MNKTAIMKNCEYCKKEFKPSKKIRRFCSNRCSARNRYEGMITKKECLICNKKFNVHNCRKEKAKYCSRKCYFKSIIGKEALNKGIKRPEFSGKNHPNWKNTKYPRYIHTTATFEYRNWRTAVFKRDSYKCKMNNEKCKGQLQAHHILPWRDFEELRYEINNGITLCQAHHPRKRAEEKRLVPVFSELMSVSNIQLLQYPI